MDSNLIATYYSNTAKKFTMAARNVSLQEYVGNWPIAYEKPRILLLYVYALQNVDLLTDNQILAIVHAVNELKYV